MAFRGSTLVLPANLLGIIANDRASPAPVVAAAAAFSILLYPSSSRWRSGIFRDEHRAAGRGSAQSSVAQLRWGGLGALFRRSRAVIRCLLASVLHWRDRSAACSRSRAALA